jgi:DNA repair protein RecO (recombination protein O)
VNARAYKTAAIVMRGRVYGEADRILTLLTSERGKLDAIAKGSRRTKSHLAGRLELGNEAQLTMHRGRTLDVVVTADTIFANWQHIVQPERFAAANLAIELVDAFCEPDLAMPDVYALLSGALRAMGRSAEPALLLPRFSLRLLDALGLAPPVDRCVQCGASIAQGAWLELDHGGFSCEECRVSWRNQAALDERDLANIAALAAPRTHGTAALLATPRAAEAIEALVAQHLGRRPKAVLT